LVNSQYREHRIKLADACAHCADRIYLEAYKGSLTQVLPEEAIVNMGGA